MNIAYAKYRGGPGNRIYVATTRRDMFYGKIILDNKPTEESWHYQAEVDILIKYEGYRFKRSRWFPPTHLGDCI